MALRQTQLLVLQTQRGNPAPSAKTSAYCFFCSLFFFRVDSGKLRFDIRLRPPIAQKQRPQPSFPSASLPNALRAPRSHVLALAFTFIERRHHDYDPCLLLSFPFCCTSGADCTVQVTWVNNPRPQTVREFRNLCYDSTWLACRKPRNCVLGHTCTRQW